MKHLPKWIYLNIIYLSTWVSVNIEPAMFWLIISSTIRSIQLIHFLCYSSHLAYMKKIELYFKSDLNILVMFFCLQKCLDRDFLAFFITVWLSILLLSRRYPIWSEKGPKDIWRIVKAITDVCIIHSLNVN